MFKLESNRLKREFRISEGNFYASQIYNKYSNMSFVPDGNGNEFYIHFTSGEEYSSKGLQVIDSSEKDGYLKFVFEELNGVSVTVKYWVHNDNNCLCKQIVLNQTGEDIIDYIALENVGIINSKTHFSVPEVDGGIIDAYTASLGQPFYIDSLFFGCEFPATKNRIKHGTGKIKYYIGYNVGTEFKCPVTIIGAAKSSSIREVQDAFFEYIDFISLPTKLRIQFNSWYDHMLNITNDNVKSSFVAVAEKLKANSVAPLDAYVVDDGWNNYKAGFWSFNKKFPNGMSELSAVAKELGSSFGMWLGPRGGYNFNKPFAKRIEKAGNGYFNAESWDICVASEMYIKNLTEFLCTTTQQYNIDYWKLDGFCLKPCKNPKHDHIVGGKHDMYTVTQMWHRWIKAFEAVRAVNKDIWLNMTCYANISPWWLQWVNSIWLQNSDDIGFADNYENQSQLDSEITYRDSKYYHCYCTRAHQFPTKNIYNHEPIYGTTAKVDYTDEEFEKYIYWCVVRGQALNELHLTPEIMSDNKWSALAKAINWQRESYHILQNAMFIGGDPAENNIYGYISWTKEGQGIIALRNPSNEETSLTLTLNKLMGTPESLKDVNRKNIYNKSMPQVIDTYSYNDKIDLTLKPFEVMIFQFG